MASAPHHYLADCLAPWGEIRLKRMFGGMGVYRDGLFFALIDNGVVYFKVDDTTRPDFEAASSEPFSYPHKDGQIVAMNGSGGCRTRSSRIATPCSPGPTKPSALRGAAPRPNR
ncbi:TfoX/Sxy family protein [Asticcacaulis solisilvae]|uniref:TfoX/Sxy family protein n=1 Tax=Asticcacaulis solisilvae TaxID=1217274 RepID=UPI003FD72ADC